MTAVHIGYDTTTPGALNGLVPPPGSPTVAILGYQAGTYADLATIEATWPLCRHAGYATDAGIRSDILDVERGDADPSQCSGWFHDWQPHKLDLPAFYASASNVQAVIDNLAGGGHARHEYLIESAHYGIGPHICAPGICGYPAADATQWTDTGPNGENVDRILFGDHFWPQPAPVHPHGVASAHLQLDLASGRWAVTPLPGHVVFGEDDRWASVEVQVNERTGQWRQHWLPWNAGPLGG